MLFVVYDVCLGLTLESASGSVTFDPAANIIAAHWTLISICSSYQFRSRAYRVHLRIIVTSSQTIGLAQFWPPYVPYSRLWHPIDARIEIRNIRYLHRVSVTEIVRPRNRLSSVHVKYHGTGPKPLQGTTKKSQWYTAIAY